MDEEYEVVRAEYDVRADGSPVGKGFLGDLEDFAGDIFSEYTVQVDIDGEMLEIPTVVPTLSKQDLEVLRRLEGDEVPEDIVEKAVEFAMMRQDQGLPVFADEEDEALVPELREMVGLDAVRY